MVKIRLRRMAPRSSLSTALLLSDSRFARDGRFIGEIGYTIRPRALCRQDRR